jgi:hypothetical protein
MRWGAIGWLGAGALLHTIPSGCLPSTGCTEEFIISAVTVRVVDAANNELLCGAAVSAISPSGRAVTFSSQTGTAGECIYAGIGDNDESDTTTWQVTATVPGYNSATIDLSVPHDGCHVRHAEGTLPVTVL